MLNLLMTTALASGQITSEQIDSLKVTNRQEDTYNTDGTLPLDIKAY
jgi:hypothetical protein